MSEGGVVGDEKGQRVLHLTESGGSLGHHAEGDCAREEPWRRYDIGEDDRKLSIAALIERKLCLCEQDTPAVVEDVGEPGIQRIDLALLATIERDALGVLAHTYQPEAKIRFKALLLEVERNQPATDEIRQ